MRQPRVPEYRENESIGRYLKTLVLFLKDFCNETWTTSTLAKKGLEGISFPVTSVFGRKGDVSLALSDLAKVQKGSWDGNSSPLEIPQGISYVEAAQGGHGFPADYVTVIAVNLSPSSRNVQIVFGKNSNKMYYRSCNSGSVWGAWKQTITSEDTAANANKLGGQAASYYMADFGRWKTLWSGSWSSGTITVPNTGDYNVFMIGMSGQNTTALAVKYGSRIRGIGGYATDAGKPVTYQFSATASEDVWTFVACNNIQHLDSSTHNAVQANTVTSIVGVI